MGLFLKRQGLPAQIEHSQTHFVSSPRSLSIYLHPLPASLQSPLPTQNPNPTPRRRLRLAAAECRSEVWIGATDPSTRIARYEEELKSTLPQFLLSGPPLTVQGGSPTAPSRREGPSRAEDEPNCPRRLLGDARHFDDHDDYADIEGSAPIVEGSRPRCFALSYPTLLSKYMKRRCCYAALYSWDFSFLSIHVFVAGL